MVTSCIQRIKKFVPHKDYASIKSTLQQADIQTKGLIFEQFLEFLYAGNGWLVSIVGGRSDAGADLLLYHPSTPTKVSFIIQAKNHKSPLSFDDTKIELIKFEEQAKTKYQCNNYKLISINGFVENAKKLETFGMGLYSWAEIEKLILNYKETPTLPSLELVAHNKLTHFKINHLFENSNKVAVIQATGTGKSYLIGQSLIDNISKQCLVLAPSIYILQQQERLLPWLDNVTYMTYAKAVNFTINQWQELNAQFIVMDEFHRAGADTWGKGVELLIKSQPKAKYLGTTATHIRFLDSARNMADELFDNVIANELSLQDAIAKEILPSPFYISALYQLKETIADYKQHILLCKATKADKEKSNNELESLLVDWEASSGVPDIFNKHLTNIHGKFIIFCESVEHLDDMSEQVRAWFRDAAKIRGENIRRYDYVVHSQLSEREVKDDLSDFENADNSKGIHLLFSVNMLNEGLHIKGVNGVVLLRKTTSPIVYFQQIGRCLQVDGGEQPVIFDLVNNINNIQANTLEKSLKGAIESEQEKRLELGLPRHQVELHIIDEVLALKTALASISDRLQLQLDYFEFGLNELIDYKNKHSNCLVHSKYKTETEFQLGSWVSNQRNYYAQRGLTEKQILVLNDLGFDWNTFESKWSDWVDSLTKYQQQHGDCDVPQTHITKQGKKLGSWVKQIKRNYFNGKLSQERVHQLSQVGFVWSQLPKPVQTEYIPTEQRWNDGINALINHIKEFGCSYCTNTYINSTGFKLGGWVSERRKSFRRGKLSAVKIEELNSLDFIWDAENYLWERGLIAYKNYVMEFSSPLVPKAYPKKNGLNLSNWVLVKRREFVDGKLSSDKVDRLNELGFVWDSIEYEWDKGVAGVKKYKAEYNDCNVPVAFKDPGHLSLGSWVRTCRKNKSNNQLNEEKITELDHLGFIWDVDKYNWEQGVSAFQEYKNENDDCLVSDAFVNKNNFSLGVWLRTIKKHYKNKKLSSNQISTLEEIGIIWDFTEYRWNGGLQALISYKQEFNNCLVNSNYIDKNGFKLGGWVSERRKSYRINKLEKSKIQQLDALGFVWSIKSDS
jgi:superfamily II DNA or RNA helicase